MQSTSLLKYIIKWHTMDISRDYYTSRCMWEHLEESRVLNFHLFCVVTVIVSASFESNLQVYVAFMNISFFQN